MTMLQSLTVWKPLEHIRWPQMKVESLSVVYRTRVRRRVLETVALIINMLFLIVILKSVTPAPKPLGEAEPTAPPPPPCEPNVSAYSVEGFDTFPQNIQDVLLYRHCRDFPMLLNAPEKCHLQKPGAPLFLLAVKSAPSNYERREVLRKTWASERLQNGMHVRTVFLTGTTGHGFEKKRLNTLLELENQKYQDILQWDFTDTFYNLTLKQVLFLDWLERWCPTASFLFNGDDDVFANTDNMVEYLRLLSDRDGSRHLFVGHMLDDSTPIRENTSKYYIPVQIEPGDLYPPYCSGGGYLYSSFTARTIRDMVRSITLMPIDDVYMGMCLKKAGLQPMSHMGVWADGLDIPSDKLDSFDPCHYRELILVHKFLPHQIYVIWHEIHRKDLNCAKKVSHV
ncbi:N-acetyllactosaminide beta-1,3-N-acetylglucosaminyltransferase 3-like [Trichomycterus rosablanca]|uniref:N-acetyllactosaminide beta-1,3-N-acetylglucosaminyltransferase 3-like n=1 Tax=Trichomycterus rosablanca TaxID=2290929 RepID=UPI002F354D49